VISVRKRRRFRTTSRSRTWHCRKSGHAGFEEVSRLADGRGDAGPLPQS